MKQIGHVDGALTAQAAWKTHTLGMLLPHDLFIPNPGERENVSADNYEHIGWIIPDNARQPLGGKIYETHEQAGPDSRPAYVVRVLDPERTEMNEDGTIRLLPKRIPLDTFVHTPNYGKTGGEPVQPVTREEFEALVLRVDAISASIAQAPAVQAEPPMTFYDYAFIAAYCQCLSSGTKLERAIEVAHAHASVMTRNRANQS